jgi:dipeptidyl aminopeptidase/acylaminoacyl peptidase
MPRWLRIVMGGIALWLVAPLAAAQAPAINADARPAKIPAINFARGNGLSWMRLSPDGNRIAMRAVIDEKPLIVVLDAATQKVTQKLSEPESARFAGLRWAGNNRLLITLTGFSLRALLMGGDPSVSKLYVLDLTTKQFGFVGKANGFGDVEEVLHIDPGGAYVLLSMQPTIFEYPAVWRLSLNQNSAEFPVEIQPPKNGVWQWYVDTGGTVRLGLQPTSGGRRLKVWYRTAAGQPLKLVAKIDGEAEGLANWSALQLVPGSDEGLAFHEAPQERMALRKFNFATLTPGETIFAVAERDVEGAAFDAANRLIGATWTDDRDQTAWFDPALKQIQARLETALRGSQVRVIARATDNSRMIVWAGSESDPGGYYIYSAAKATLDPFSADLFGLEPAMMAQPKPVSYNARDGTTIDGYLTLPRGREPKGLPLIILPHGGPYGVRDKLDFSAEVQFLANRGYAVLQPNYRGSSGYGDAFDELGRGQIGRAMQDDIDDAMDWAVNQGFADPARVCVVGSSYGGYAALWAVTRNPERYRCAASFAGVTDWSRILKYDAQFFSRYGIKKWKERIRGADNFDLKLVSPLEQIARLNRPVLLAHGKMDSTVPFAQFTALSEAAKKAGKPLELLVFDKEGHGFDVDANEAKWYDALDTFLAKHNPAD